MSTRHPVSFSSTRVQAPQLRLRTLVAALSQALVLLPIAATAATVAPGSTTAQTAARPVKVPVKSIAKAQAKARAAAIQALGDTACGSSSTATNCVIVEDNSQVGVPHEQPGSSPAAISRDFGGTSSLTAANGKGAIDFLALSGMGGTADTDGHHGGIGGAGASIDPVTIESGVTATGSASGGIVRLVTYAGLGGGGQGAHPPYSGGKSGDGGGAGTVSLNMQGTIIGTDGSSPGIVAAGFGGTGGTGDNGGSDFNGSLAGNGGGSNLVTVTIGGTVKVGGFGAQARGTGGAGGVGPKDTGGENSSDGSNGGVGGSSTLLVQMTVNGSVTSTGNDGIYVITEGGAGGVGGSAASASTSTGGNGGAGGFAAPATATVAKDANGNGAAMVSGALVGVSVRSSGGAGGNGGDSSNSGNTSTGGTGGAGGAGGNANADVGTGASVTGGTTGVLVQSLGGAGGNGGTALGSGGGTAGAGGLGGAGGIAKVEVTGTVAGVAGASAIGVQALSSGGTGGTGAVGSGSGGKGTGGAGGTGGIAGAATVIIDSGASVTTTGADAPKTSTAILPGVLVQANGGGGGIGGDGTGAGAGGGAAGYGGTGGVATATVNGTITTSGSFAHGVLAQSVGGAGAQAGDASAIFNAHGGAAHNGGNANTVYINGVGTVTTTGTGSAALVGQSVGGGGGAGGNALAAVGGLAIGGNGGAGGNGGSVEIGTDASDSSSAPMTMVLTTRGDQASGMVAQSIGGAGGNGGNAVAYSGTGFSLAIGGDGKGGGDGGKVTVQNDGVVTTFGNGSGAIAAQSVGGGGGNGGAAIAISANQISTAFALGGSGGTGGSGGIVDLTNNQQVTTYGTDSYGLKAQTIEAAAARGGAATSVAVALQVVQDPPIPTISVAVSLGGSGGAGGDLSASPLTLTNNGFVTTSGHGSTGVIAQSIAGGGGNGGDSSASAYSAGDGTNISASAAVGGSGKSGGTGGQVTVNNNGFILTLGESAYGVLAQSIGGGGGTGGIGDSSASAGAGENSYAGSVTVGGTGGTAGNGGLVTVNNNASIATQGDSARGVMAQSIGGGGGASGGGTAKANGGDLSIGVTVGGNAGNGGNGGTVTINNTGSLLTTGAEADAIFAQSIAGGGGTAGKGASTAGGAQSSDDMAKSLGNSLKNGLGLGQNVVTLANGVYQVGKGALSDINSLSQLETIFTSLGVSAVRDDDSGDGDASSLNLSATIGGTGGTGGTGGSVTVTNSGAVQTNGTKSDGIFAQSIGGGGGVGGASSFSGNLKSNDETKTASLRVGASGTSGGVGGAVTVTNAAGGSIATSGVTTYGIDAQSVGGGGGKGGTEASKDGALKDLNVTLGGNGGTGGDGGVVTVNQNGTVTTRGRFGIAVLGMSVGGGGGIAHVLSSDTGTPSSSDDIHIVANLGGSGGAGGNGGAVTINMSTPTGGSTASVSTSGMGGIGLMGQSIGGGGGVLVTTSAVSDADGGGGGIQDSTNIPITIGGSGGATGNGGAVTVALSKAGSGSAPYVVTSGADAYGILAQSVGGGGGLYTGTTAATADLTKVFTGTGQNGDGGAVTATLSNGAWIYTSGAGAVGILAQSVGGGGGLFGGMSKVDLVAKTIQPNAYTEGGQGGNVTVDLESGGNIVTTGAKAHGIFAQSVGGGGGVIAQADGNGYAFAGGNYTGSNPATGLVTVTVGANSVVQTSGEGAYGIFVQSRGNGNNDTQININAGGYVESWNKSPAAIYIDGAGTNTVTNAGLIDDGTATNKGTVSASGVAITGNQPATITNQSGGVINGSTYMPVGASTFNNLAGAHYSAGALVELGSAGGGQLNNAGTFEVGGKSIATTRVHADLTQAASGSIVLDVDSNSGRHDTLQVDGNAKLAGSIALRPASLTPTSVQLVQTSAAADTSALTVTDVGGGRLFGYTTSTSAGGVSVTPYSKLLSVAQGASFGTARVGAAGHLQQGFVAGISPTQATLYGQLASLSTAESYRLALDNLSGEVLHAVAISAHAASLSFSERLNSCPVLDPKTDVEHERNCGWVRAIDNSTERSTTSDAAGYTASARTLQTGGQIELGNGWLAGGSLAFDSSSIAPSDTGGQINGHSTSVGVVVKREAGAWLFSGGLDYGTGHYDSQRSISIGTVQANASGDFDMSHVGLHGRVAYRLPQDGWYAKPYADLHAVRMHTGAFSETGAGDLDLTVQSANSTLYTLSPMVEFGTRRQLDSGYTLHGFVATGALLHAGDAFGAQSSLQGMAASGATPFQANAELPKRQAKVNLGVDIGWKQSTLRLEYGGEFGQGYRSNTATVRMNVLF